MRALERVHGMAHEQRGRAVEDPLEQCHDARLRFEARKGSASEGERRSVATPASALAAHAGARLPSSPPRKAADPTTRRFSSVVQKRFASTGPWAASDREGAAVKSGSGRKTGHLLVAHASA
jgi:hypothetical protein